MGRLIDTDVLEEFIKTHSCSVGTDGVLLTVGEDKRWHNLLEYIPTAYDVDKAVEELKKASKPLGIGFIPDERYIKEEKAIEIVKQGSVSDDVCEWKLEDEEANLYVTKCQQRHLIFEGTPKDNGYTHCPYCGKKIKVVDNDK